MEKMENGVYLMRNNLSKKIINICLIFALALSGLGGFYFLNKVNSHTKAEATLWKDYLVVKEATKYSDKYKYGEISIGAHEAEDWSYDYIDKYDVTINGTTIQTVDNTLSGLEFSFQLYYKATENKLYLDNSYITEYTFNIHSIESVTANTINVTTIDNVKTEYTVGVNNELDYTVNILYLNPGNKKLYVDNGYTIEVKTDPDYTVNNLSMTLEDTNFATDISSEDVFILDNYLNNQVLQMEDNVEEKAIEGIYLEFNKALTYLNADMKTIADTEDAINDFSVEAYLNNTFTSQYEGLSSYYSDSGYGLRINTPIRSEQTFFFNSDTTKSYTNMYWNDYLDMTNVWGLTGNDTYVYIPAPAGLYTYVFKFDVLTLENNVPHTENETFVYQFYLTDDGRYVEYPAMNRSEKLTDNEQDYSTYYYNFDTLEYPTYTYDASKYNVSFLHTDPNGTGYTYESQFSLINANKADELGILTFTSYNYEKSIYMKLDKSANKVLYYSSQDCTDLLGSMEIDTDGNYLLYIKDINTYKSTVYLKTAAKNTPISYYYNIILSELGTYTFTNKYLISASGSDFKIVEPVEKEDGGIIENINLAYNVFKNKASVEKTAPTTALNIHSDILIDMEYKNGMLVFQDGKTFASLPEKITDPTNPANEIRNPVYNVHLNGGYNLVLFGTKASFYKLFEGETTKQYTQFADLKNGIYADITSYNGTLEVATNLILLTEEAYKDSSYMMSGIINDIPVTNLAPIYFDQFGSLTSTGGVIDSKIYRWDKNLTKSPTKRGYYIDGTDVYVKGAPSLEATYITDTTCQTSGLYLIVTSIAYGTSGESAVQCYMFIVDSTTPDLYFYTLDNENEMEKFSASKTYTNVEDLYFTWAEPTYFQEGISATISYSANWKENGFVSTNNYAKDTIIGGTPTMEGLYRITIYYGKKNVNGNEIDRSNKNCDIKVDRTAPTAEAFTFDNEGKAVSDGMRLFNENFVVYSDPIKTSGAEVTARYAEINFTTINNFAPTLLTDDKTITTNRKLDIYSITENNFDIYNLNDNAGENLKLGSPSSLTPTKLYIFELTDEAGNVSYHYYMYDNSTPYAVIQQSEDKTTWTTVVLDKNTISESTRVLWGTQKAIPIANWDKDEKDPFSIEVALNHITDNTAKYLNLQLSNIGGTDYLVLPLQNARVQAGSNDNLYSGSNLASTHDDSTLEDTDVFAQNVVIFPKGSFSNNVNSWYIVSQEESSLNTLLSLTKTEYVSTFYDILGNVSNKYELYLDTDMAQLALYDNYDDIAKTNEHGINKGSFNINNLYVDFLTNLEGNIRPYVTFDYYTFAFSNYLTDDASHTKTESNVFNTSKTYKIDDILTISPLYPFNSSAEISNEVVRPAQSDTDIINGVVATDPDGNDIKVTKEGLYVFKRVYHDIDGNVLTDEQVKQLNEYDSATIYMFVIVDRNGIISLEINSSGNVLTTSSIGDYITMLLGSGTEDEIDIDAFTLNQLRNITAATSPLFETGRVVVNAFVPNDKYATNAKLNSEKTIFANNENNSAGLNKSIALNKSLFRLYIDLTIEKNNKEVIYIYKNSVPTVSGKNYIKNFLEEKDGSLTNTFELIANGIFTLTLRDYNSANDLPEGHETSIKFTIKHEYPEGEFVSFYDDANHTKYQLELNNVVENSKYFRSVNKDALSFEFEDNDNIYHAQIDPNHFIVEKGTMKNGIFNGSKYLLVVNGTTANGDPKVETIANGANIADVLKKQQINTTTVEDEKLYRYTINIFDGYTPKEGETEKILLSERDEDCTYAVTIFYKGQESDYVSENGVSYFSCTYYIHQDLIAPSQNLNNLKAGDKGYIEGSTNLDEYFLAISNDSDNPTVFHSEDIDESYALYLRKYNSLDEFAPSLLPGDEHFGSLDTNLVSFNPDVVNAEYYESVSYHSTSKTIDFSSAKDNEGNLYSGYYEILELDAAQNITRYFAYIGNGKTNYLKFDYKEKLVYPAEIPQNLQIKSSTLGKTIIDENTYEDAPHYLQVQLATLTSIYYGDTDYLKEDGDKPFTSKISDYYIKKDADLNVISRLYFDKYITAYIKNGQSIVETIACDPLNETLDAFFNRIVAAFTALKDSGNSSNYSIEILNRFGENYVIDCLLPGAELELKFTETNDLRLFVEVPAKVGNVYLTEFIVKQGQNNVLVEISQAKNGEITTKAHDTNGLQYAKYEFGPGLYTFTITDNFGRTSTTAKYIGTDTDDDITIDYGNPTITTTDNTYGTITRTRKDVNLKISQQLYNISVLYGESLSTLESITPASRKYIISDKAGNDGRHVYTFNSVGYYVVSYYLLATNDPTTANIIAFNINRDKPKVYVDFESGGTQSLKNEAYSENITIYWESENRLELNASILYVSNSGSTTTININDVDSYYVNEEGTYNLTVTDAIGNSIKYTFTKIASSYSYFSVSSNGMPLKESDYSENTIEEGNVQGDKTRLYYYVNYSGTAPSVVVAPDASKGITALMIANAFEMEDEHGGIVDGNNQFDEYEISASNSTDGDSTRSWVICYVRIVYIEATSEFADFRITQTQDKDGNISETELTPTESELYTPAKQLKIQFNSISKPEVYGEYPNIYNGNTTRLLHYYNGVLIEIVEGLFNNESGIEELYISSPGLHTFEIFDLSNNQQLFGSEQSDRFSVYLINEVIYEINDGIPINNAYYNDSVKLSIIKTLGTYSIYEKEPVVTVLYNGKALEVTADKNGDYLFENPGYYNVTISGEWIKDTVTTPLTANFNFTIINQNVALIAFNVPTSYGFTIKSIFKNEANMSANIVNPTTLWLSAGDPTFGSGLFTINASYYNQKLNKNFDFSFKVWINEETPIIMPVDYTYGTKTSKVITLQYNGAIIYSQIGEGYILITNEEGGVVSKVDITSENQNQIEDITFSNTGTYTVGLYNKEGKLVSSYKVIKSTPLNSSAKIIIIIASAVVAALTVVFIILRRKVKFR